MIRHDHPYYQAECTTCGAGFTAPALPPIETWVDNHLDEHPDHVVTQPQDAHESR